MRRSATVFTAVLAMLVALLTLTSQRAEASGPLDSDRLYTPVTFYAYVQAGETLNVDFSRVSGGGGTSATVSRLGAPDVTCQLTGPGSSCGALLQGLQVPSDSIVKIAYSNHHGTVTPTLDSWNIEVRSQSGSLISGRVFTEKYTMVHPSGYSANFGLYLLSPTGAAYRADLYGYQGRFSVLEARTVGNHQVNSCLPAYGSYPENSDQAEALKCGVRYRLFFEQPDSSMPPSATRWSGDTTWLYRNYNPPAVTGMSFLWDGSPHKSGVVRFALDHFYGAAVVNVDIGGDGTVDRTLPFSTTTTGPVGVWNVPFDGKDQHGNWVPSSEKVTFEVNIERAERVHLLESDVDVQTGGVELTNLRTGNTTVHWDDSPMLTGSRCVSGVVTSPAGGVDSTGGAHSYAECPGSQGAVGNDAVLDTWAYTAVTVSKVYTAGPGGFLTVNVKAGRYSSPQDTFTVAVAGAENLHQGEVELTGGTATGFVDVPVTSPTVEYEIVASSTASGQRSAILTCDPGVTVTGTYPVWQVAPGAPASCTVTHTAAPTEPQSVTVGYGANGWDLELSWDPSADDGGTTVTGYVISGFGPSTVGTVTVPDTDRSRVVVEKPAPGTYTLYIAAKNEVGLSDTVTRTFIMDLPTLTVTSTVSRFASGTDELTVKMLNPDDSTREAITMTGGQLSGQLGAVPVVLGDTYAVSLSTVATVPYGATLVCDPGVVVSGAFPEWQVTPSQAGTCAVQWATVPTVPLLVAFGKASNGWDLQMVWSAPYADGGSDITGYVVTGSGPGGLSVTETLPATAREYVFESPDTGSYTFTVAATNNIGTSEAVAKSSSVDPTVLTIAADVHRYNRPGDDFHITVLDEQTGNVIGELASFAGSTAGELSTALAPGKLYLVTVAPTAASPTSLSDYGVVLSCVGLHVSGSYPTWAVQIRAPGAVGCTAKINTVPTAPTSLSVTVDQSSWRTNVTWQMPADTGGSPISGYSISISGPTSVPTATASAAQHTWVFPHLKSGEHVVSVTAFNNIGVSEPVTFTITVPKLVKLFGTAPSVSIAIDGHW